MIKLLPVYVNTGFFAEIIAAEPPVTGLAPLPLHVPQCAWDPDWVVDSTHVGNGKKALNYLAQYVFRIAIAPSRIVEVTKTHVTFNYQPSGKKTWKKCTLSVFEFMRRTSYSTIPLSLIKYLI
jgi:hypothetical protein